MDGMHAFLGHSHLLTLEPLSLTFKVDVSVCVNVQLLQDLFQLSFLQLLPQQRLDRLLHFLLVDLSISVEVKLSSGEIDLGKLEEVTVRNLSKGKRGWLETHMGFYYQFTDLHKS